MKITITIPEGVYAKLEGDRGSVPRSTYIQDLIMGIISKGGVLVEKGTMVEPKKWGIKSGEVEKLIKEGIIKKGFPTKEFKSFFKDDRMN
jgi:hypothetical protein